jgi:DNA-directed RNA polymerase subunit E'/Rpb7
MVAMSAVREKLNNILFKYNDDMQGVPIAYENVSFPPGKDLARIYGEYPWLHVEVSVDVLVFKPMPKERVFGRINKVSENGFVSKRIFELI